MGWHTTTDPKMKVNFRMRQSFLCRIEEISYELDISQTSIVDMILSSTLPTFEKTYKQEIDLIKNKKKSKH